MMVLGSRSEQQLRAASSVRPPDWAVVLPWPHCCITDDCPRECKRYPHSASFSLLSIYIDLPIQVEKEMATHSGILAWRIAVDRGAWQAIIHGVAKSQTQLSY